VRSARCSLGIRALLRDTIDHFAHRKRREVRRELDATLGGEGSFESLYRIEEDAFTRSRRGVARPIFHKGEQVGEWRHYDERLTMFLLRARRPQRYGKWIEKMLAPEPQDGEQGGYQDPGFALDAGLTEIEFEADDVPPDEELHPRDCRGQFEDEAGNGNGSEQPSEQP
jgi:hypothetical protein